MNHLKWIGGIVFLFLFSCEKDNGNPANYLDLKVKIENNITFLNWEKADNVNFNQYTLRKILAKNSNHQLDTISSLSFRELIDNYSEKEEIERLILDVNANSFIDSSFIQNYYVFYSISVIQKNGTVNSSKYIRLRAPGLK